MNFIELQADGEDIRINLDHVQYFTSRPDGRTEIVLTNRSIVVDNNYEEVEEEQLMQEAWSMKLHMDEETK